MLANGEHCSHYKLTSHIINCSSAFSLTTYFLSRKLTKMENWKSHSSYHTELYGEVDRKDGQVVLRMKDGTTSSVSQYLESSKPSLLNKTDPKYFWILNDNIPDREIDYPGITAAWNSALSEKRQCITQSTILEIADKYSLKSGKWIYYPKNCAEAEWTWDLVVKAITEGELKTPVFAAYIHLGESKPGNASAQIENNYVIIMYTEDFTDENQRQAVVDFLRKCGINCELKYKADIFTHLSIYPKNKYGIRPTIFVKPVKNALLRK